MCAYPDDGDQERAAGTAPAGAASVRQRGGAVRRLALTATAALLAALVLVPVAGAALPPIHHVFVIVEENENDSTTFGAGSPAPYLSTTLRAEGAYVPKYYGIGHESNDNYIAMISGQAPNPMNQADCQYFDDFAISASGAYGQEEGPGCVYPANVPTIASQLSAAGLTWRDYNDGMGADPTRETAVCGHPAVGAKDHTETATAADQYATRHDPFVYFHSIIDDTELCDTHVVGLTGLARDLAGPHPPSYTFITPDLCNDGHDATCAGGGLGGLARADQFLRTWVPRITGSRAFTREGGLLMIIFDESAGPQSDSTACCGEIAGPASPLPGINGPGGGDTGAILLSPYIRPGTVTQQAYNHYTMLRSVEDLFGLSHIGYAGLPGERSFGSDVFACAPGRPGNQIESVHLVGRGRDRRLALYSVGAASLAVRVTLARHRTTVIRRTLAPCRTYVLALPHLSHAGVALSAAPLSGRTQRATLRY